MNRPVYEFGDVRVDPGRAIVRVRGIAATIEPKSFDVLCFLVEHRDRLVGKEELLEAIWKDTFVTPNVLTRAVAQIRKALGDDARESRYIETVARRGYRFIAPVTVLDAASIPGARDADPELAAAPVPLPARRHVPAAWAAAGVLLVAAIAFGTYRASRRAPARERIAAPILRRVTTQSRDDFSPSLSPDARSIAYVSDRTGHLEVYVVGLAPGSRDIAITSDGGENVEPAWSPDGRWLAFHSRKRDGIWIVPATGGTAQQIVDFGSHPAWAPDSERLVFSSYDGGMAAQGILWTVRRDGSARTALTRAGVPAGGHRMPSWSHDGRWIVFEVSSGKPLGELWIVSTEDRSTHLLTRVGAITDPRFGAGDRYVYWGGVSTEWNPEVTRIPFDAAAGGETGPVETVEPLAGGTVSGLSIADDGTAVLSLSQTDANLWAVDVTPDAGGSAPIRLTDSVVRLTQPAYSPDGRLAYSQVGQTVSTWTMKDDGSERQPLLSDVETTSPQWASDASRLLVVRMVGMAGGFAWVDATTRRLTPLEIRSVDVNDPRLSPDDRDIAFHVIEPSGVMNVWRSALDGSDRRRLTNDAEAISYPSWSHDGRWLAVEIKRGDRTQVGVLPREGGAVEALTDADGQSWPNDWAPDNDGIVFAGERGGIWNVFTVSRRTGQQRQLTHFTSPSGYVRWPVWSPRGGRIVFERSIETASVWSTKLP